MKPITNSPESDRREAEAWLARAMQWEQVLDTLRHGPADEHADAASVAASRDLPAPRREAA